MFSEGEYERGECSVSEIRKKKLKELVYFRRLKKGNKKKNIGKEEGYGGNEAWESFYFKR